MRRFPIIALWLGVAAALPPTASLATEPGAALEGAAAPAGAVDFATPDARLRDLEGLLEEGHFRTVIAVAKSTRQALAALGEAPGTGARRARLEVLVATAEVALGRNASARASFRRALDATPGLALDESTTSPKVLKVLDSARARSAP